MKKTFLALCTALTIIGCSSDNDSSDGPVTGAIYLPLDSENYWTYDVDAGVPGRDSLYVAEDVVIGNETFKKMKTQNMPFGFFSASLRENGVRYSNGAVMVSGSAGLNLGPTFPVEVALNNFVLLRENAADNQQLSSVSANIEQDFQGYPLMISYTLKSTAKQTLPTYTSPNGESYTNVKSVQLTLNMKITTTIDFLGVPIELVILAPQDVVVSTSYFAKDIGMVHSNTVLHYELEDFSSANVTLPIPSTGTDTQLEFLSTYDVQP